jgi:flagellin
MLLSALTINASTLAAAKYSDGATAGNNINSFASATISGAINLNDISVGVFTQALQNVATLRADNGASMSRLAFASDNIATTKTNMEAANGRIVDVDIAAESTRMAKYNVLVQASASMLAQANSSTDIALMLIR